MTSPRPGSTVMPVEYAPPWPRLALVHQHHREGTLVLTQRGDTHEVRNTGSGPLKTLNVYIPPAYTGGGEELPAGRS